MPMALADAKIRVVALAAAPANPEAPTVAELTAGIDLSCRVLKSDYRLSATSSDTVADTMLCSEGNAVTYGASNYEGSLTVFRFFDDATGATDAASDEAYQALKTKGSRLWIVERFTGKKYDVDFAAGDEVKVYEIITDNPQAPSDLGGYIKNTVPLGVQRAWLDAEVAAATV